MKTRNVSEAERNSTCHGNSGIEKRKSPKNAAMRMSGCAKDALARIKGIPENAMRLVGRLFRSAWLRSRFESFATDSACIHPCSTALQRFKMGLDRHSFLTIGIPCKDRIKKLSANQLKSANQFESAGFRLPARLFSRIGKLNRMPESTQCMHLNGEPNHFNEEMQET